MFPAVSHGKPLKPVFNKLLPEWGRSLTRQDGGLQPINSKDDPTGEMRRGWSFKGATREWVFKSTCVLKVTPAPLPLKEVLQASLWKPYAPFSQYPSKLFS